jgi:hypothetical protein
LDWNSGNNTDSHVVPLIFSCWFVVVLMGVLADTQSTMPEHTRTAAIPTP